MAPSHPGLVLFDYARRYHLGDTRASSLANQEGLEDVTGLARVVEGVNAGKKKKNQTDMGNQSQQGRAWAVVGVRDTVALSPEGRPWGI